ncbi:MAG: DNA-binding transcriptional LysR family regulator [Paracoccaceae bacterium]|jgi:DNA-binding transcriptional LysR family regulator
MRRLDALTFKQLRALSAVAETGSISRAAEQLRRCAQPSAHAGGQF